MRICLEGGSLRPVTLGTTAVQVRVVPGTESIAGDFFIHVWTSWAVLCCVQLLCCAAVRTRAVCCALRPVVQLSFSHMSHLALASAGASIFSHTILHTRYCCTWYCIPGAAYLVVHLPGYGCFADVLCTIFNPSCEDHACVSAHRARLAVSDSSRTSIIVFNNILILARQGAIICVLCFSICVCVLSFYPSTSSTTSVRADSSILEEILDLAGTKNRFMFHLWYNTSIISCSHRQTQTARMS